MKINLGTPEVPKTEDEKPETKAARQEKERLLALIMKNTASMASDYKRLIGHTDGLVNTSMVYAYSKGIQDVLKLLVKEKK